MLIKFYARLLMIASCAGMLFSCHEKHESGFFSGTLKEAFEEAANEKKYLMVISENDNCPPCTKWNELLTKNAEIKEMLSEKYLLYKCVRQVKGNEILAYALGSVGSPTTLIFNENQEIGSIITGNKKDQDIIAELYAFESGRSTYRLYNSRISDNGNFGTAPRAIEKSLKSVLLFQAAGNDSTQRRAALAAAQMSASSLPYFYNCYLCAMMHEELGNKLQAKQWALKALDKIGPYEMYLYRDLINEIKGYADVVTNQDDAPVISVSQSVIKLGVLKFGHAVSVPIKVYNHGKRPLIMKQVVTSCSCLSGKCPSAPIAPGDSATISLMYDARSRGVFNRRLSVLSNAENLVLELTVSGVVE